MSLRLHPKYGANPTMATCIICGENTGVVVLLGASYPKKEAPMHMVIDFEPCAKCKKKYFEDANGVMLVEVNEEKRPLGGLLIMKREAFQRVLVDFSIGNRRVVLVNKEAFTKIMNLIPK